MASLSKTMLKLGSEACLPGVNSDVRRSSWKNSHLGNPSNRKFLNVECKATPESISTSVNAKIFSFGVEKKNRSSRSKLQAESTQAPEVLLNSEVGVSYELLRDRLAAGEWEEADNETRRLLCVLAGEGAEKRKWVYFTEVQFIPTTDLLTIDSLWRAYSNNRFGYSVQKKLWLAERKMWKPFFLRIGWTYGENSNYKKFPMDFSWEIEAPEGHLPLTNALRGTQLFEKLLNHPAFENNDQAGTGAPKKIEKLSIGSNKKDPTRDHNILDELYKY